MSGERVAIVGGNVAATGEPGGGSNPAEPVEYPGPGTAPPDSTTGVKTEGVAVGVHWLALTAWTDLESAVLVLASVMGVKKAAFEQMPYGGHAYRRCFLGPQGVKVYGEPVSGEEEHSHLVVTGGACEVLGGDGLQDLARAFERMGVRTRASRVDLALDGGEYSPADAMEAFLGDGVRTYTRRNCYGWRSNDQGTMFTMGNRQSERFGRVYDRRGATRFELECKSERAAAVWSLLAVSDLEAWPDLIRSHVRDFCDFLRPWWDALMGGTARAMLRLGTFALATAESARAWLRKQAAPWLAALTQVDGGSLEFIGELLSMGRHRYGRAQQLALSAVMA